MRKALLRVLAWAGAVTILAVGLLWAADDDYDEAELLKRGTTALRQFLESEPLQPFPDPGTLRYAPSLASSLPGTVEVDIHDSDGRQIGYALVDAQDMRVDAVRAHAKQRYVDLRYVNVLTPEQALQRAEAVVRRHMPSILKAGQGPGGEEAELRDGRYQFHWEASVLWVHTGDARVGIRVWDGKLGSFSVARYKYIDIDSIERPKMSPEEVMHRLRTAVAAKTGISDEHINVDAEWLSRRLRKYHGERCYVWVGSAVIERDKATGIVDTYVIDSTGEVGPIDVRWHSASTGPRGDRGVFYRWPVWADGGESIASWAPARLQWAGYPFWDDTPARSVVVSDLDEHITRLLRPLPERGWPHRPYQAPCVGPETPQLLVPVGPSGKEGVCTINLTSGDTSVHPFSFAGSVNVQTLTAFGRLVCFSTDVPASDEDIVMGSVPPDDDKPVVLRSLRVPGQDSCPVFADDGQVVYFAHSKKQWAPPQRELWAIYRVGSDRTRWRKETPHKVIGGFARIERMSMFPDGRILVCHAAGLDVVDPEVKTKKALDLPPLHDPDLPDGQPLRLRDPAVSPDGKLLAFSGYRDPGYPGRTVTWHIYTCKLDGSEVKRVTPLEGASVEPYVFPETGKVALQITDAIGQRGQDKEERE